MGYVTFVGAGPYDAQYLTMAGKQALETADCVLYDHLLDPSMLSYTKAECIYVGKLGHHPSMKQEDINVLLIEKAKQYKQVVRLKGGDSLVFGRGGEEGLALHKAGISFHFIPGITSAIAVAESVGIPVTHRGVASGFLVLSAHLQNHELQIPFEQVSNPLITLLFLMGNSRISQIIERLLEAGRSKDTPIAIISHGCSSKQQVLIGTLKTIIDKMRKQPPVSPTIIVVGDVVRLHDSLKPSLKPLSNKQILVYKVNGEESPLTTLLKEQGAYVVECQSGEIHYRIPNVDMLSYTGYIFTSKHAIHAFFHSLQMQKLDIRALTHKKFIVIGEKCGEVLAQYGIYADQVADGSHVGLLHEVSLLDKQEYLYLCGDMAPPLPLDQCIVYENREVIQTMEHMHYDAVCFTCASSVMRCCIDITNTRCISIGKTTSEALRNIGCNNYETAKEPSYEAMLGVLLEEEKQCIVEED